MATIEEARPIEDIESNQEENIPPRENVEPESLKRKASLDDHDEGSPKRAKQQDGDDANRNRPRRDSSTSRRSSYGNAPPIDSDRRKAATQEEKKRGRRLFGGLLSTLSQTTGNSQQRRRLDIERRQQERIQKQTVEDESRRTEKRARLTEVRMSEQIAFDEQVMKHKHTKMLAMAKFLRTRSHPQIYYLPWRLTPEQESDIEAQVREAKAIIDRDLEVFEARRQRRGKDDGRVTRPARSTTPDKLAVSGLDDTHANKPARSTNGSETAARGSDKEHHPHHHHHNHHHSHHHHHHDETADVLEEADEDMVIY